MNKLIKFSWRDQIFFVKIPKETISLYLHSIGLGNATDEAFHSSRAWYNLANLIKVELSNIIGNIKLVTIIEIKDDQALNETFPLSFSCDSLENVSFSIQGTNLQKIIDLYYASQLKLDKIDKTEKLLESIYHKYQIDIVQKTDNLIHQERFIACKIELNGYIERLYISTTFAEYIYKKCYPCYVPFDHSTYNLTLIRNIINLWLRTTLKTHNLTVIATSLTQLPVKKYSLAIIKNDDFSERIFFPINSHLLAILKTDFTTVAHNNKNNEKKVISPQQKMTFNVTKYLFNLSMNQLRSLKVNDVILLAKDEIIDGIRISCGNKNLSAAIVNDNKIIINSTQG